MKVAKYCAKVALVCVRRGSSWQRVVDIVASRHKNMNVWETLEVVCGSVDSSRAHRPSRTGEGRLSNS